MSPEEIKESMIDSDTIIDMLEQHKELYLTIRADDVKCIKQRLSQAKHKRGTEERMRMVTGDCYKFTTKTDIIDVVDLHLMLGSGADVFVVRCNVADDTL